MRLLTTQQITDRYATLPKNIADVVKAEDINLRLYKIANSEGMGDDDALVFINLAHLLLVKLIPPSEAGEFMSKTLEITLPLANNLVRRVYAEIVSTYQTDFDALSIVGNVSTVDNPPTPVPPVPTPPPANHISLTPQVPKYIPPAPTPTPASASTPLPVTTVTSTGSWRDAITKNLQQ